MPDNKVLKGRAAVDVYRAAHAQLYVGSWHQGISEAHTPLLEKLLADLKMQGFNSLDEFFTTSDTLNIQELGFADREDFMAKATKADREVLDRMWH